MSFGEDIATLVAQNSYGALAAGPGWTRVPLGEIARVINGFAFESRFFGPSGGLPLVRIRDVVSGGSDTSYSGPIPVGYGVEDGDLLVGMDGDFNSAFWRGGPALLNQRVCKIVPNEKRLRLRFLAYALPAYLKLINEHTSSVTVKHLSSRTLQAIPLPLPERAVQDALVARIDALFAEIDEGERALAAAREGVETYRKSLLKAAVTGELTADWRLSNPPAETGEDLLRRILADRASNGRSYPGPPRTPFGQQIDLPGGWCWASVEAVGEVQLGRQRAPQHHAGDDMRPYLRVANVLEDRLDLTDVKWMNFTPLEFETFALRPGDVLLNEGQAPDLIGRPAIYRGEVEGCCFQKTLLRFRAGAFVAPEYALLVFRQYMRNGRFKREARITTNIGHLTQVRFLPMEFPVPPLREQVEISRKVAILEREASGLPLGNEACADLRQSILSAAFQGNLLAEGDAS